MKDTTRNSTADVVGPYYSRFNLLARRLRERDSVRPMPYPQNLRCCTYDLFSSHGGESSALHWARLRAADGRGRPASSNFHRSYWLPLRHTVRTLRIRACSRDGQGWRAKWNGVCHGHARHYQLGRPARSRSKSAVFGPLGGLFITPPNPAICRALLRRCSRSESWIQPTVSGSSTGCR